MNDRFKFRVYITENDAYPEKVGYVNTEDFCIHPDGEESYFNADYDFAESVIEQCTGLKDKNGDLIYEGDIVEFDGDFHGDIAWDEDAGCWAIRTTENTIYTFDNLYGYELEVVGNIHENADLLENQE